MNEENLEKICNWKKVAECQKGDDLKNKLRLGKTECFEKTGCFECTGYNTNCLSYTNSFIIRKDKRANLYEDERNGVYY